MSNKMLIDAIHPEETRVVVLRDKKVEDFDFEAASKRPLRGNIYLARVTRVEPSLQAAFIEYGGNRHGFLAFSEIHPDYYQIPLADRQALLAELEEDEAPEPAPKPKARRSRSRNSSRSSDDAVSAESDTPADDAAREADAAPVTEDGANAIAAVESVEPETVESSAAPAEPAKDNGPADDTAAAAGDSAPATEAAAEAEPEAEPEKPKRRRRTTKVTTDDAAPAKKPRTRKATTKKSDTGLADPQVSDDDSGDEAEENLTSMGSDDALEEVPERRRRAPRKTYKIQEVIKRKQILLVQVVKEERGTKGAALTTYLSLAGRYSVLMPNTNRGGGVSRKITDNADRKRLKSLVSELEVPEGMGIILRTAGAARTKTEIKRDFEYLIRLWESVRDLTLKSIAPELVYEEGNLVKRAIRDLYSKEIEEIQVSGETAYREAKDFMKMLMPSHAKNVKPYREATPVFTAYGVESQLDAMFSPTVTLPAKGSIVINPTEALVAIDVNSGKSNKESNIEDTAYKTNLEAADEVARQLRLRDLAGLIVIDFIDMDDKRHIRAVEKRLKDALKMDRSRIQVGRISPFGLMEMSRQRIRQGMVETSMVTCEECGGTGHVRSTQSVALYCLRALEEHLLKHSDHHLTIRTSSAVALYILNQKRTHLNGLEERFRLTIGVHADENLSGQHMEIVNGDIADRDTSIAQPTAQIAPDAVEMDDDSSDDEEDETTSAAEETTQAEGSGERSSRGRRRRRRRRGGGGGDNNADQQGDNSSDSQNRDAAAQDNAPAETSAPVAAVSESDDDGDSENASAADDSDADSDGDDDSRRNRRRRGRRGGRRHRREDEVAAEGETEGEAAAEPESAPVAASPVREIEIVEVTAEADASNGAAAEDEAEADAEDETPPKAAPEAKADAPKQRRGWWQRRSFF
ncbi:ribonuclease E/G [Acuticoccus sp. MNP-M23]|uniref:Rne/Rng family ribonuclease n=1 Tax=Acuticoccus sp. MNP-M23 TaxID=3072793 RepID=UPI002815C2E9|nr:ribonuclease E/G [Acuticoccus sp. MNP-M23]WMS42543.1 ribonuclease E/G [Acuticoccus sp. MNP-M23]